MTRIEINERRRAKRCMCHNGLYFPTAPEPWLRTLGLRTRVSQTVSHGTRATAPLLPLLRHHMTLNFLFKNSKRHSFRQKLHSFPNGQTNHYHNSQTALRGWSGPRTGVLRLKGVQGRRAQTKLQGKIDIEGSPFCTKNDIALAHLRGHRDSSNLAAWV